MSDLLVIKEKYEQLLNEFKGAEHRIHEVVDPLIQAGDILRNGGWKRAAVPGFPVPLVASAHECMPGNLPTIKQVGEAIVAWHATQDAIRKAWTTLPDVLRANVEAPTL